MNVRGALYGLRGVRVGEAQNFGPVHANSEVSSTFLDGLEADLRHDVTQLSPTPASSGAIARFVGRNITPVGVEGHRAASRRLVLVGDLNTTNSPVPETQVDLSGTLASSIPGSVPVLQMAESAPTVPDSSEIRTPQNHAQVVVPALSGGIPLHNSFDALRRNDEEDVPIGHEGFFGDESDTESLPDSGSWRW